MAESTRQWGRQVEVIIGKAGQGISVSSLRVQFEITKTADATPNKAVIKIFNLAPRNEEKVKREFDEVLLNAGYKNAVKLVFRGDIRHVYRYTEKNNSITEVEAGDGEKDIRTSVVNSTLAAGGTTEQMIEMCAATMPNTQQGPIQITDFERPRGRVLFGPIKDVLDELAQTSNANWSVQDGALNVVQVDERLPEEAFVVNANTGMIGTPEVNENGITVTMLLNPLLKIYGAIKLDNNNIKELRQKKEPLVPMVNEMGEPQKLDPDGVYKVTKITHKGDTHGKEWQTTVECVAMRSDK